MAGPIRIAILGNASSAVGAIRTTEASTARLGARFKATAVAAARLAAAGVALGAGLAAYGAVKFAEAAAQDQQQAALLAKALKTAAGATDAQVSSTESWISAQGRALGVTDDDLRPALAKLATATGSVAKAQKLASLAMDVSAGSQKSLSTISAALAKAQATGSVAALAKYGVATKDAQGKTLSLAQVTQELADKYGGAAKTKANTFQGQLDRLKLTASEAGEAIGYKLIPVLTAFAGWLINKGIPAATRFGTYLRSTFGPPIREAASFIGDLVQRIAGFVQGLRSGGQGSGQLASVLERVGQVAQRVSSIFSDVVTVFQARVLPVVQALAVFLVTQLLPAVLQIYGKVATNLKPVFDQLADTFQSKVLPGVSKLLVKFEEYRPTLQKVALFVIKVVAVWIDFQSKILGKVLPVLIRLAAFLTGELIKGVAVQIEGMIRGGKAMVDFGRKVYSAGQDVVQFVQTVGRKIGQAVNFVQDLPGKVKTALSNAPTLLLEAGKQIVQGLIDGIKAMAGKAADAAVAVVKGALDKAKGFLHISSPSKVWYDVGKWSVEGFLNGLTETFAGGSDSVKNSLSRLTDFIDNVFTKRLAAIKKQLDKTLDGKALSKAVAAAAADLDKQQSKILKATRDVRSALLANGKAIDANNAALATAVDNLTKMRDTAQQYADQIRDSVVATGNLVGLGEGTGFANAEQLVALLKNKVDAAQQFAGIIDALRASGLSEASIQQLINAGVEGGIGTAKAILAGGPAAIKQINDLQAQLAAAGTQLGGNAANALYGAGIQAAQGLVDGLAANADVLAAQATKLAKALVKAVKKALGINSPSTVFKTLGKNTVQGLALGLDQVYVRRQGASLASSLQQGFGSPALAAFIEARAADQRTTVEVSLTAQQLDALSRGKAIQADLDVYRANGGRARS